MKQKTSLQRGQALVLLALGIVGLIGLTALAIDGGRAFADRRHAQNAADNASYAAALEWVKHEGDWSEVSGQWVWSSIAWRDPAFGIANANGFNNEDADGIISDVTLDIQPFDDCENISPFVPAEGAFITVTIETELDTLFAPIVGISKTYNRVQATSVACGTYTEKAASGSALAACHTTKCNAMFFGGNNVTHIYGSGALVNSSCDGPANGTDALGGLGTSSVTVEQPFRIDVVGDEKFLASPKPDIATFQPAVDCFRKYIDISNFGVSCDNISPTNGGPKVDGNGIKYLEPGIYTENFPPMNADEVYLIGGVYCLEKDFRVNNVQWRISNQGGLDETNRDIGVTFVVDGDVTITNGEIRLLGKYYGAPLSGRLLLYAPAFDSNNNIFSHTIRIEGNGQMSMRGTLYAPTSDITLAGTPGAAAGEAANWYGQVIGSTVAIEGTVNWTMIYDDAYTINFPVAPNIAMQE